MLFDIVLQNNKKVICSAAPFTPAFCCRNAITQAAQSFVFKALGLDALCDIIAGQSQPIICLLPFNEMINTYS
jgi:hypothetical protein